LAAGADERNTLGPREEERYSPDTANRLTLTA
jgi:hypothetical protein